MSVEAIKSTIAKKGGLAPANRFQVIFAPPAVSLLNLNAENIVGLHGAGFANIIFCKPKTKIIELKPETAGDAIKNLAVKNDLFYQDLNSKTKTLNYDNNYGDIEVNIDLLKKKLI